MTTKTDPYAKMTDEEFDQTLREVINDSNPSACEILQIPGIYEILREYYNNEVLDRWTSEREEERRNDDEDE